MTKFDKFWNHYTNIDFLSDLDEVEHFPFCCLSSFLDILFQASGMSVCCFSLWACVRQAAGAHLFACVCRSMSVCHCHRWMDRWMNQEKRGWTALKGTMLTAWGTLFLATKNFNPNRVPYRLRFLGPRAALTTTRRTSSEFKEVTRMKWTSKPEGKILVYV